MYRHVQRFILLLFTLGSVLSAFPVAVAATPDCGTSSSPQSAPADGLVDACCDPPANAPGDDAPSEPSDCCPDDCDHCPLPCCGGIPAVTGFAFSDLIEPAAECAAPSRPPDGPRTADLSEIDHPPQS